MKARRISQRQVFHPGTSSGFFVSALARGHFPIPTTFTHTMLHRKIQLITLLVALPFAAFGAGDGRDSITLAEALARTLRGSPELAAYDYDLRAAEARILQAGLRPNPELSLNIENPTGSGPYQSADQMENTLTLSQLIELG